MTLNSLSVLRSTFGFADFRGHQAAAIKQLMHGKDALVLMPTGGGKSLCYQIPALLRPGTGIVISPLIALMQNQVDSLRQVGVKANFLNSTLSPAASARVQAQLRDGELDLLYIAPERLVMPEMIALLKQSKLALFAIDEAHCISQWGHDFRKDYLELALLEREFPEVPRIALTATADVRTRDEIIQRLSLKDCAVFVSSFDRPNIQYRITEKIKVREQLLAFLDEEHQDDSGIVYCLTRKSVDQVAAWLAKQGRKALPYHAGLSADIRKAHLDRFLKEEAIIVVATIAFGMGIDKPDVRFVAHLDLPKNLEAYYQETGRAGRDGLASTAWMAYGIQDVIMLRQMLDNSTGDATFKRYQFQKIQSMLGFCELTSCRRQVLLQYFGETLAQPCGNCDSCLTPVQTWDATIAGQKALSCIYRTDQRFGVNYLIDVLLGQENERMVALRHHEISTFGIGKDISEGAWRSIYRQLISRGFVSVDDYGSFKLDDAAWPLLRGEQRLLLRVESTKPPSKKSARRGAKKSKHAKTFKTQTEAGLFAALSAHRLSLAKQQNLPSYCIFHNRTLDEMARTQPKNLAELRQVSGVGDAKLEKYGQGFLQAVEKWRRDASEVSQA